MKNKSKHSTMQTVLISTGLLLLLVCCGSELSEESWLVTTFGHFFGIIMPFLFCFLLIYIGGGFKQGNKESE